MTSLPLGRLSQNLLEHTTPNLFNDRLAKTFLQCKRQGEANRNHWLIDWTRLTCKACIEEKFVPGGHRRGSGSGAFFVTQYISLQKQEGKNGK